MKTGEVLYEKVYMSLSASTKDLLETRMEKRIRLGSEHAQRSEAGQLSRSFQSNQPTLNPIRERSVRPDITHDVIGVQDERKTSRSQEIDFNSFREEPSSFERTGRHVITHDVINVSDDSQTRSAHESETFNVGDETLRERTVRSVTDHDVSHESIMLNEVNMHFRIPGRPHSVVKHAQSTSVRE